MALFTQNPQILQKNSLFAMAKNAPGEQGGIDNLKYFDSLSRDNFKKFFGVEVFKIS